MNPDAITPADPSGGGAAAAGAGGGGATAAEAPRFRRAEPKRDVAGARGGAPGGWFQR